MYRFAAEAAMWRGRKLLQLWRPFVGCGNACRQSQLHFPKRTDKTLQ
jgi:hypothetical protein